MHLGLHSSVGLVAGLAQHVRTHCLGRLARHLANLTGLACGRLKHLLGQRQCSSCPPPYAVVSTVRVRTQTGVIFLSFSKQVREVVMLDEEVHSAHPTGYDTGKWKKRKIYYPSRDDPESVELSIADIQCLDPESYLSSPIMNFYIQYLQRPESAVNRPGGDYHFFSTYFYKKLGEAVSYRADKACFAKLRRWWKGVNIFEKSYIFVPVHGNLHWSLVVICIPAKEDESGPVVLHLDSLGIHNSCSIFDVIDRYLIEEWNCMNQNSCLDLPISEEIWRHLPQNISNKKITVPQQKNEYDCGLFVLYFMEKFIEEAPDRLRKNDLTMFGSEWFRPEDASGLRKRLQDLLLEVFRCSATVEEDTAESTSSGSSLADD
ncbi:hypothetical protein ZIOFF_003541 [Zingiber officinale]|uniref:Ubiquitin-like protease family profile domain-containing protein n=1 Tax=Zingiber officinale TaxID=94328 RepID=A0A8J5IDG6_ZINOF|nr:hypothetical protein ZIOFF_003541 [Zingiber officinale]